DPVHDQQVVERPAGARPVGDLADLGLGEAGIRLELQDLRAPLLGPGDAGEGGHGAGLRAALREAGQQRARLERLGGQPDHPPLIGGRKATSDLAESAASPRTIRWSMETCTPGPASASPSRPSSAASARLSSATEE